MAIHVRRNDWGIPHLTASDPLELAYAQGSVTAADRAWQLDAERRRAEGTTAAHLGTPGLSWDILARRARLTDTARRAHARLERDTREWISAYTDGVNAALARGADDAPEFAAAGIEPAQWQPWTPLAVWLSTHLLFAGFPTKLWREEVASRLGEHAATAFAADGPGTTGSNGWLVPGDRTATGAPLLAGDPHRIIEDPGIYQQIRLTCPEYDVAGLAVPGVPGIAHFGHTGHVAWAITNAMADYQDLYTETLRRRPGGTNHPGPDGSHGPGGSRGTVEALGPDGWRAARTHTESIEVAGAETVTVEVIETDRGPVIVGGPGQDTSISLRCPTRAYDDLGFDALPALLRSRTVADVDEALDRWVEPVNVVLAADTSGGLLHRVAGRVPERNRRNTARVVPAWDAAYTWSGRDLPLPRADVDGITVMANEAGLSAPLGVEFAPRHRAERIRRLLQAGAQWSGADMATVHTDTLLPDGALPRTLPALTELSPAAAELRDRLLRWNRRMDADSTDAGAYAALRSAVVRRLVAHPNLAPLTDPGLSAPYPAVFRPWLDTTLRVGLALDGLTAAGLVTAEDFVAAVRTALEETAETAAEQRPWGATHRLAPWRAAPTGKPAEHPPLSGDNDCVLATSSVPGVSDRSLRGPAARYVWDLARRDDSLWIVPLGASGIPTSPHHRDQQPLWLRGDLIPLAARTKERPVTTTAVHEQQTEGFGTVRIAVVDPAHDIDLIHDWVSQPRARFWGMTDADRETVRGIYAHLDALTTHHAYLVRRDGKPVALFQTYDPAADRLGECYDVQPGDVGVHVLLGPAAGGRHEPGFTARLFGALTSFLRTDPSHRRIVAEPDARNEKVFTRLARAGFTLGPEVTLPAVEGLPAKRARLAFLALVEPSEGLTPS